MDLVDDLIVRASARRYNIVRHGGEVEFSIPALSDHEAALAALVQFLDEFRAVHDETSVRLVGFTVPLAMRS